MSTDYKVLIIGNGSCLFKDRKNLEEINRDWCEQRADCYVSAWKDLINDNQEPDLIMLCDYAKNLPVDKFLTDLKTKEWSDQALCLISCEGDPWVESFRGNENR